MNCSLSDRISSESILLVPRETKSGKDEELVFNKKAVGRCVIVIIVGETPSTRVNNGCVICKSINKTHK